MIKCYLGEVHRKRMGEKTRTKMKNVELMDILQINTVF